MSPTRFAADVRETDGGVVIVLTGDINALAEDDLERAVTLALATDRDTVVLDFERIDYINSTGIALVVSLLRRARAARVRVVACGLSDHYREIFEITRLVDYMPIADDEASALRSPTTFLPRGTRQCLKQASPWTSDSRPTALAVIDIDGQITGFAENVLMDAYTQATKSGGEVRAAQLHQPRLHEQLGDRAARHPARAYPA